MGTLSWSVYHKTCLRQALTEVAVHACKAYEATRTRFSDQESRSLSISLSHTDTQAQLQKAKLYLDPQGLNFNNLGGWVKRALGTGHVSCSAACKPQRQ